MSKNPLREGKTKSTSKEPSDAPRPTNPPPTAGNPQKEPVDSPESQAHPVDLSDEEYTEMVAKCAMCQCTEIDTEWVPDIFQYGCDQDAEQLIVSVPLRCCSECSFRWHDHVTGVIKDTLTNIYARDRHFQPDALLEPEEADSEGRH